MGTMVSIYIPQMVQGSIKMIFLLTNPCNFCGHSKAEKFLTLEDLRLNLPGSWDLVKCQNCGLLIIDPQPSWEELSAHYPKEYHAYLRKDSKITEYLRGFGLRKRVKSILRKMGVQKGSLLDVGSATGDFLDKFQAMSNWNTLGVEIVPEAAEAARAKGLTIIGDELENARLKDNNFDVITLWDVLEHMPDPAKILQICYDLLKPGGMLVLKCPDPAGKEALLFKESWIGFEAPQHLFGFPKKVLINKLKGIGFDSVSTANTGSDYSAFFVSFGHWLNKRGWHNSSKFIISVLHKSLSRIVAGIIVRPIRWLGIKSSCTYYCQKPL